MNRDGHRYVKPTRTTTAPVRVAVVVPSRRMVPAGGKRSVKVFEGGSAWVAFARRVGTEWVGDERAGPLTPAELWDWVDTHLYDRTRLWVVSPVASDMLTLMGFWEECDNARYLVYDPDGRQHEGRTAEDRKPAPWVGRLVLRGVPDIVTARRGRRSVQFVSFANYVTSGLPQVAAWVGAGHLHGELLERGVGDPPYSPAEVAHVLMAAVRRLITEWVRGDCGVWRDTASQLVVSLWRRHHYTERICRHADDTAAGYEAEALHGGRASVWFYGTVDDGTEGPPAPFDPPPLSRCGRLPTAAHRVDVTSMYPALLRDQWFPVRLTKVVHQPTVRQLAAWVEHFGVIACVTARLRHAEYPFRHGGRTAYPLGTARVVLAGPELARLIADDSIVGVHTACVYDMGRPFASLCSWLLSERQRCKDAGDSFGEVLFKSWANKFGGKFAQRSVRWEVCPKVRPPVRWGTWRDVNADGGAKSVYRALAGVAFEQKEGRPGAGLLAAVFAYLTAYGRDQMRTVRESLPPRSVLSQDTDGLWLTSEGLAALERSGSLDTTAPGRLRLVESVGHARWYTAKHYYAGGAWTLAGIPDGWTLLDSDTVVQGQLVNPIRSAPQFAPRTLTETITRVKLSRIPRPDPVGPDGWAVPVRAWHGKLYSPDDSGPPADLFGPDA